MKNAYIQNIILYIIFIIDVCFIFQKKYFSKLHTYTKYNILYLHVYVYLQKILSEISVLFDALNKVIMFIGFRNVWHIKVKPRGHSWTRNHVHK